jgi:hypothetical protein
MSKKSITRFLVLIIIVLSMLAGFYQSAFNKQKYRIINLEKELNLCQKQS